MEENNEGKSEKFFKDFGKKVDQFLNEAKDASDRLEGDLRKKYEELKVSAETLKKEAANKERWKEVEDGLKRAGEELEKTLKAAFKKRESR
jgi:F0F1-type ATP synthase membrane subunit b/b'